MGKSFFLGMLSVLAALTAVDAEPLGEQLYSALYPERKEVDIGPLPCTKLGEEIRRAVEAVSTDGYQVESRHVERFPAVRDDAEVCQATLVLRRLH